MALLHTHVVITRQGWIALGELLRVSRESQGWSQDDLISHINVLLESENLTETKFTKSTLSNIERGNVEPRISNLYLVAHLGYVKHPVTNEPMDIKDLIDYAAQNSFTSSARLASQREEAKRKTKTIQQGLEYAIC